MEIHQHDSPSLFRFVLRGDLAGPSTQELEHAWTTAQSILGKKEFVVDVGGLTHAEESGFQLLLRMRASGARLVAAEPPESAELAQSLGVPSAAPERPRAARFLRFLKLPAD